MWWSTISQTNPDDGLCLDSTLRWESRIELRVDSERDYNYNPESPMNPNSNSEIQVTFYRATMAIDNQSDGEVVDGATNFQRGR